MFEHSRSVAALLLLVACGSPDVPQSTTAILIQYPDSLPVLRLIGEQRYSHQFSADAWHIPLAGLDAANNLYVLDRLTALVAVLPSSGSSSWTIGGEGDGPAELRRPTAAVVAKDRLLVVSQTRISEFLLDGTPVQADRFPNTELWVPNSLAPVYGGFLVAADRLLNGALLRFDRQQETLDTLLVVPYPELHQGRGESWHYPLLGLTLHPPIALSSSGLAYTSPGSPYEISVWTPSGQLIETRGTNPPPVRVGEVDQQAYEWLMDVAGNERADRNRKAARWRDFVGGIVADGEGNLLVNRRDLLAAGTQTWDYLTSNWTAVGRIIVPWNLSIELLAGCNVYGVEIDGFGAGSVLRYRIDPCPTGPPPGRSASTSQGSQD